MSDKYIRRESESPIVDSDMPAHTRAVLKLLGIVSMHPRVANAIDVHDLVLNGLPRKSLKALQQSTGLSPTALAHVTQISPRSYQRLSKEQPFSNLTPVISSNLWQFAYIYVRAVEVMGTQILASQWLNSAELALNGRRPIDLLSTQQGTAIVCDLLTRLDYGVYT